MDLKHLTDKKLIEETKTLVAQEREILTEILRHLAETQRRRLYSDLGYKSLFEYATKELGYGEAQAYRRIQAMRLTQEIPTLENKINEGSLNLTHISLAQTLFRQEDIRNPEVKTSVLEKIQNLSTREAEKTILSLASQPKTFYTEKERAVSEELTEIRLTIGNEFKKKIDRLRGLLAHKHPGMTTAKLFELACDEILEKLLSAQKKRGVKDQCVHCGSRYALEIDHIVPRGKNGTDDHSNLRTLCRNCNQRAAIKEYGQLKMDGFIN